MENNNEKYENFRKVTSDTQYWEKCITEIAFSSLSNADLILLFKPAPTQPVISCPQNYRSLQTINYQITLKLKNPKKLKGMNKN